MMGHDKLENVYKTNFALMQHHKWSLSEIEQMMPWEKNIYVSLLQQFLQEEEEKAKERELERKNQANLMTARARKR